MAMQPPSRHPQLRVLTPTSSSSEAEVVAFASTEEPEAENFSRTLSQIKKNRVDLGRRYVFLCPTALSKHFDVLPELVKSSALLVFKCSRDWLLQEPADVRRLKSKRDRCKPLEDKEEEVLAWHEQNEGLPKVAAASAKACRSDFTSDFIRWVLAKEQDGCVFWFKPEKDLHKLSRFFESKIDPLSGKPYRPLKLDTQWWRVHFARATTRYATPAAVIANISERSNAGVDKWDLEVPALQELISQSNPTLEPISKWPHAPSMRFVPKTGRRLFAGLKAGLGTGGNTAREAVTTRPASMGGSKSSAFTIPSEAASNFDLERVVHWPQPPRERLDNLYHQWEVEDAMLRRRHLLSEAPLPRGGAKAAPPRGLGLALGGGFGIGKAGTRCLPDLPTHRVLPVLPAAVDRESAATTPL